MTSSPPLPAAAQAIALATTDAVVAAGATDVASFDEAVTRLAAADAEQVRVVLGVVVRALLEDLHPDGVSGDDLLELIKSCARTAYGWYPRVELDVLVVVLTGALGVHEPELEPRKFSPPDVARHAPLFVAELLSTGSAPGAPAPAVPTSARSGRALSVYFADAYREISQAELNEMP